jgi:hypothetical protein
MTLAISEQEDSRFIARVINIGIYTPVKLLDPAHERRLTYAVFRDSFVFGVQRTWSL